MSCPCCGRNEVRMELLYALQRARDYLDPNDAMKIASGYRCPDHNRAVGGKNTSSHIKGLAVDIFIDSSSKAFRVMQAIFMTNAFVRIGFGKLEGKVVLHVDIDSDKATEVLWGY